MAIEHKQALRKFIGSGGDSEMSYSIDVEDGEILYHTHTVRYHDNRPGSGIVSSDLQALRKFIGSGGDSEMSYSIDVEDGEILYHTHTVRYHDNRPGSGIVS